MKLYELCGADRDVRFSPFVWRAIMCLHHKGLAFDRVPLQFLEIPETLETEAKKVPVLLDGDKQVDDSLAIALYLEEAYPDKPLFVPVEVPQAGTGLKDINSWVDRTVCAGLFPMLALDIHDCLEPEGQAYFRKTREIRINKTLEAARAERDTHVHKYRQSLEPLREGLKEQPYFSGRAPAWFDYCVFGGFQWARIVSDYAVLLEDDPLYAWRERMLDLFGGVARTAKLAY